MSQIGSLDIKQLASRGWKKREPFDDEIRYEHPSFFSDLIKNKINNASDASFFLSEVRLAPKDIENILLLDGNYFDKLGANLIDKQITELDHLQLSIFDI